MSVSYAVCHWCDTNATTFHRLASGQLVGVCRAHLAAMSEEERAAGDPERA